MNGIIFITAMIFWAITKDKTYFMIAAIASVGITIMNLNNNIVRIWNKVKDKYFKERS